MFFGAKFLQVTGFTPMMDSCSKCNTGLGNLYKRVKTNIDFSTSYGGVLCRACSMTTSSKIQLNASSFRLLTDLFRLKMEDLRDIEVNSHNLRKVYRLIENYIVFHTDCNIDSFKYLKKIGI